jgi:hypothetical protein
MRRTTAAHFSLPKSCRKQICDGQPQHTSPCLTVDEISRHVTSRYAADNRSTLLLESLSKLSQADMRRKTAAHFSLPYSNNCSTRLLAWLWTRKLSEDQKDGQHKKGFHDQFSLSKFSWLRHRPGIQSGNRMSPMQIRQGKRKEISPWFLVLQDLPVSIESKCCECVNTETFYFFPRTSRGPGPAWRPIFSPDLEPCQIWNMSTCCW